MYKIYIYIYGYILYKYILYIYIKPDLQGGRIAMLVIRLRSHVDQGFLHCIAVGGILLGIFLDGATAWNDGR